jgi:sugar lactone lactonase YvrE
MTGPGTARLGGLRFPRCIYGVVCLAAAAGCSQPAGPIFEPIQPPLVWPSPPEQPRIRCVGQLTSSRDLHIEESGWEKFTRTLTGKEKPGCRLVTPRDVAVLQDKVYVADPGVGGVVVFDLAARSWAVYDGAPDERLLYPTHLTLSDSRVFVSDAQAGSVAVFDSGGRRVATWGKGRLRRPAGLCWCPVNNRLYVADVPSHSLFVFDAKGDVAGTIGGQGTEPGRLSFPLCARFDPKLGLLVADSMNARISRFDLEGRFLGCLGERGDAAGNLSLPKGVACDSHGHIYVVDSNFENVQIFNAAGQLLLNFGGEGQQLGQFWLPEGICIDDRDRIWVADTYNRRIQVFEYLHVQDGTP